MTAADFTFKVINPADATQWIAAPAPAVALRRGLGAGGTDRISLKWADGAIRNNWLQVTVLANARTGLASPDVFYFGNLAGEAKYDVSSGYYVVNAFDSS